MLSVFAVVTSTGAADQPTGRLGKLAPDIDPWAVGVEPPVDAQAAQASSRCSTAARAALGCARGSDRRGTPWVVHRGRPGGGTGPEAVARMSSRSRRRAASSSVSIELPMDVTRPRAPASRSTTSWIPPRGTRRTARASSRPAATVARLPDLQATVTAAPGGRARSRRR